MTRNEFKALFHNGIVMLDGATGTQMHKSGMPAGACPEKWATENPEPLIRVQRDYIEAGSHIVYTFSMGGNAIKLKEYSLSNETYSINKRLAEISKEAAGDKGLVAGDLSSCGSLLVPYGEIAFEESVESYKEQIRGLLDGGVDLFAIETMLDIQETRAALIAIRELCDLPVIVTMTYEAGFKTLMGTDPVTALVTLQSLGADAVGCNCSSGPSEMVDILTMMKPYAKVPLIAKPNAGKPKLIDGKTVFDMDSDTYCSYVENLVEAGANGLGGCCGTTPEYIRKITQITRNCAVKGIVDNQCSMASSNRQTVFIHPELPLTVIGERLNPTGKKVLKEALLNNNMDRVADFAQEQLNAGAGMLDVNAGVPGIDEKAVLVSMVNAVCNAVPLPVCLDSSNPEALEAALRIYPGRAVINSISGEEAKLNRILPLAAKYGAMFVLLPIDDKGVPETAEERIRIIQDVFDKAKGYGFNKEDILVDGVVMTVAADQKAARETLRVLSWCSNEFGINTVVGLSNISFGLPERELINSAFLSMAVASGLSSAIMNPNNEQLMHTKRALDVLKSRDQNALNYIRYYSTHRTHEQPAPGASIEEKSLFDAVVNGLSDKTEELIKRALENGETPENLINESLIPAIQKVGSFYEEKKYFLPQLIKGAEAMERAMSLLSPLLSEGDGSGIKTKGTVVIATVKGDIHDIGKNIVALLLKNYGFNVIDLGKDVPKESIIEAAKSNNADIMALSALMTTTMTEMPKIAQLAQETGLNTKMMVGGAVLDKEYAESFNAYYSKDAYSAVKLAEMLIE